MLQGLTGRNNSSRKGRGGGRVWCVAVLCEFFFFYLSFAEKWPSNWLLSAAQFENCMLPTCTGDCWPPLLVCVALPSKNAGF